MVFGRYPLLRAFSPVEIARICSTYTTTARSWLRKQELPSAAKNRLDDIVTSQRKDKWCK